MLFLGIDLKDKVLGILGAGRIGRAVGKRAYAFCMKIYYSDKNSNCYLESELNAKKISLRELLKKSDILSVHVPLTQETFHLLGRKELSLMKSSSIIINTARGEVIDEKVLIDFLQKNKIAAAGFDVYEGEPKVNKELLKLKNVVVLPHIGSATIETRNKMIEIAAQNIIDRLFGKKPKYLVNPEVYES
jgi:glyoxylate reductase